MEYVVVVREVLQNFGDGLLGFGSSIGVGNAFFELESSFFE